MFPSPLGASITAAVLVLLVSGVAFGARTAVKYTDRPTFCASCHEMSPYYAAWRRGPHSSVACVSCHVDPGNTASLLHKVVALKEVYDHLAGAPKFPLTEGVTVPNRRCLACHSDVGVDSKTRFSHERHATKVPCTRCHADPGHSVTTAALARAGILASPVASAGAATYGRSPFGGVAYAGTARVAGTRRTGGAVAAGVGDTATGHVETLCRLCHDMTKMRCGTCHEKRHAGATARTGTACLTCHRTGPAWTFTHPATGKCADCHRRPKNHSAAAVAARKTKVGRASGLRGASTVGCTVCHRADPTRQSGKGKATWSFSHPSLDTCGNCHKRPAQHRSGACVLCHRTTSSWTFSHPVAYDCGSCHSRPANHSGGNCSTCHRSPGSWAFSHTSSGACGSCHQPPGNHFGSSCASCHSPGRGWAASFNHPGTGGEHSWRSFSCASCHPRGYDSADCHSCHARRGDGASGGD